MSDEGKLFTKLVLVLYPSDDRIQPQELYSKIIICSTEYFSSRYMVC